MALYFSIFSIIILNFIILIFLRPIERDLSENKNQNSNEIPQIVFKDFQLFDISDKNILTTTLEGEIGEGFKNGNYKISNIKLSYQKYEYREELKGNYAFYNGNDFQLFGNIKYNRSDNSSIESNSTFYDIKNGFAYIPDKFKLSWHDKDGEVNGENLVVLIDNREIYAMNIRASFKDLQTEEINKSKNKP